MGACNLCGGTRWETLEEVGATRVVRCACGLVFVTPPPPRAALEAAYDAAYYQPWEAEGRSRQRIWQRRMKLIDARVAAPGRLLDVGCGPGDFLEVARARRWQVTGTELSAHAVKTATARGLDVAHGEVWEAGLPPSAFDVATSWHVIEHVADPRRVLVEMHRVLRPGGWLVLATPNLDDRIFRAAYRLARGRRPPLYELEEREIHLFHFSARTLGALVAAAGFELVDVGSDRGAAASPAKRVVNEVAHALCRVTGINWGMALQLVARKPAAHAS